MRKDYDEIEEIIEETIEELEKEYDLDEKDIEEIREEIYTDNGWKYNRHTGEGYLEEEHEEVTYTFFYNNFEAVGMRMRDFL
ncbi:MAG: hypothetical protein LUH18_09305 [Oscillospiraceae bacterium]|nr:hypothetical protein [Oscillospiraceae bacterium]